MPVGLASLKTQSLYFYPVLVLLPWIDRTTVQVGEREGWSNSSESPWPFFSHMPLNTTPPITVQAHTLPGILSLSGTKTADGQNELRSALCAH